MVSNRAMLSGMGKYWKPIRQLALKETFELVRLDQPGRILLWALLMIAAAISALPEWISAGIRVLAVIGATALAMLIIYAAKLIRIPRRNSLAIDAAHQVEVDELKGQIAAITSERDKALREVDRISNDGPRLEARIDGVGWGGSSGTAPSGLSLLFVMLSIFNRGKSPSIAVDFRLIIDPEVRKIAVQPTHFPEIKFSTSPGHEQTLSEVSDLNERGRQLIPFGGVMDGHVGFWIPEKLVHEIPAGTPALVLFKDINGKELQAGFILEKRRETNLWSPIARHNKQ